MKYMPSYKKVEVRNVYSRSRSCFIQVHSHCLITMKLEGDTILKFYSPPFDNMFWRGNDYKPCPVCQKPFVKWRKE